MTPRQLLDALEDVRVLPLLVSDDARLAPNVGRALVRGGLPVVEVALRTPGALSVIEELRDVPGLVVGAGTVRTAADVDACATAGAQFAVSPGTSAPVVDRARQRGLALLPGVATASDIMAALLHDVSTVKFFPAEANGGPAAIRALAGPFPDVRFVPTGGVTERTAADYLALPAVVAVGGSWMLPADAVAAGDTGRIATLAARAVDAADRKGRT